MPDDLHRYFGAATWEHVPVQELMPGDTVRIGGVDGTKYIIHADPDGRLVAVAPDGRRQWFGHPAPAASRRDSRPSLLGWITALVRRLRSGWIDKWIDNPVVSAMRRLPMHQKWRNTMDARKRAGAEPQSGHRPGQ